MIMLTVDELRETAPTLADALSALPTQAYIAALAELAGREREARAAECDVAVRMAAFRDVAEIRTRMRDRAARIRRGEL